MLKDKIAVITGAARGIGRAIALELAASGVHTALIASSESSAALKTLEAVRALGVRAEFYALDISDNAACREVAEKIISGFGGADILVNNAGITRDGLLMQMKEDDFDRVISVDLKGAFNMTQAFIRQFIRSRHGSIINISSVSGLMGNAGQTNYSAAKAGLIGLTKSVAREYAARGITCSAVCPGFIETDMTAAMTDSAREKILSQIPMGAAGVPEDVARAVAFLADAHYITGEVMRVDGGMYI